MAYFSKRYLKYSTSADANNYQDYGQVNEIITDKIINVAMGGNTGYVLEAVGVEGTYVPKISDWVVIEWKNGNPVAKGGSGIGGGLTDPNTPVIVSTGDLADGTVVGNHIQTDSILARHISANAIEAEHISANSIYSYHITAQSIGTNQLSANSITSDKIQAGAITAQLISANAITSASISANSITSDKIVAGAITSDKIQANAITSTLITANAIQAVHITANAIQAQHISANAITTNAISANSINATHIQAGAINATHISANSVTASAISANSVTSAKISANSIQSQHISANSVQTQHISANSINATHIQANSIGATLITANAINANHITANAIQSQHISANSIQTQHISANSITASHIQASAITTSHLSANSITGDKIQANQISANHLSAQSITASAISANAIQGYHISANTISGNHIVAGTIQTGHISANSINAGLITANAINANHITANAITSQKISANAIQTQHISANTIQGNQIQANQISANHITANAINASHITANAINAGHISANSIQTQHISANSITGDKIQANQISGNHIVAGTINADHLTVGTVQQGLLGMYYTYTGSASNKFQTLKGSQVDSTINFSWGTGNPSIVGQADNFAVRWQGFVFAPETGQYSFHMTADDGGKVVINNTTVVTTVTYGVEATGTISLTAGNWYPILVEMTEGTGGASAVVKWTKPSLVKEVIPAKYYSQGNTVIDGASIMTGTITASSMQVGTITAQSGIIADATIQTAHIANGAITSAKIGNAEIKTANIASGNITNAHIANATIDYTKINSVDAGVITVGKLNGQIISGGTITGDLISGGTITGDKIKANTIDSLQIKSGAITTTELSAGSITSDKISTGAITADAIRAGSITAEHISTVGLDAQIMQVYNSQTGETLIGGGYLRVDGLDAGVVQSDNLVQNGLFLTSSSDYGFKRDNPSGEALLGNTNTGIGAHQVWKIDLATGQKVKAIDIPAKKPFDISVHPTGNYAYITVQGDDTLVQLDLVQDTLTSSSLKMGMGPARIKWRDMAMMDMKHFFVLNSDPMDMNIPDTLMVVDTPPSSVNGDLYMHHEIVLGNNPYDFVMDSNHMTYVTMASEGDIVVLDTSSGTSAQWKIVGRIPISAYGTDNYHGGLPSTIGLNEVTGGDASGLYNDGSMGDMSGMMSMSHSHGGYGASDGSLKSYEPHGIVQSSDPDTLYVVDYKNGELVVVDKKGVAPYNYLIGVTADGSFSTSMSMDMGGMDMSGGGMTMTGTSPAMLKANGMVNGGGPGTNYVRYRIPLGDEPDFIELVNGKLFITLEGSNDVAVIDEQTILNEINADRAYYGTRNADGTFANWNFTQNMRTVNPIPVRMVMGVGSKPTFMKPLGSSLYVSLSGQNQIAEIDTDMEMVVRTINVGTNPQGFDFTPDGRYMYIANYGGTGDLSFVYPMGSYIGDPYMGLEGGIDYQGADGWTPDRSNWVYDASGNVKSKSTVEFHINEPLLNEGGYAKLTAYGYDYQYAQIEQDITNVTNYSNGNNLVNAVGEKLIGDFSGNIFTPRAGEWLNTPPVSNIKICSLVSGSVIKTTANASKYTVYYGSYSRIVFSANTVPSGNWVEADYTARNNIYFKPHNSSTLVAIDNGSSPNFDVTYEVDEFVPKFVAMDNQQTSPFTPSANGIFEQYNGLEYSTMTNRAKGAFITYPQSSVDVGGVTGPNLATIIDDYEIDAWDGDHLSDPLPPTNGMVSLTGNQNVKIDLGDIYMIGRISVAHSYGLDRTYKGTKTEVSEDGVNWYTIYDSAVSGTYNEKPAYHAVHGHTHYSKFFTFPARPVRYVRDWANGWVSGDGQTSGNTSDWTQIKVYGDWQVEKGYQYPSNSPKAGQQIATNGYGFVSTDISKAYIAMNIQIEFTSWWYMTYIVGPQFGKIKVEMPTLMNSGHFLNQEAPFVNNVAHRHIMSFPPSNNVKADSMAGIEAGKHRVVLRQESGKVTIDRLRFEDFQYYQRSSLLIPTNTSATLFTRYKVVAEQAKWYQGTGLQSTEGAYDTPRVNPDSGIPDKSVPIKYRVRLRTELNADGTKEERGTAYVTSAIFETGKLSSHWRRSESADLFPTSRLQQWNPSQPHNTGIQHDHLANGSVRGAKILANAIMDYHISNYARIQEHKLQLNYPTHGHTNKAVLDTIVNWAGTSGNYGTANTLARGDHAHDYLPLTGGRLTGTTNTRDIFTSGNITVTGNIVVTGTIDSVDVSILSGNVATVSGNLNSHIGAGGSAHALATSGSAGFLSSADFTKLQGISANSINQAFTDVTYAKLSGNNLNGTTIGKSMEHGSNSIILGNNDWTPLIYSVSTGKAYYNQAYRGVTLSGNGIWTKVKTRLPVDPESTYFVRAKITKKSGTGTVYIGADSLDNNYASISTDSAQSYNYFGATGVTIASGNTQYLEGKISGYNPAGSSGGVHTMFDPEAKYFDLVLIANYGDTLNGETVVEWLELYKAPNTFYVGSNGVIHSGNFNTSTLNGHVGSGGSAHAVAISGGANGFIDGTNYGKLLRIQDNAINQATADARYLNITGGALTGTGNLTLNGLTINIGEGLQFLGDNNYFATNSDARIIRIVDVNDTGGNADGGLIFQSYTTTDSTAVELLRIRNTEFKWKGNDIIHAGTFNIATLNGHIGSGGSAHALAVSGGSAGFISGTDKAKLDNIQVNAINESYANTKFLTLTGGTLTGDLTINTNLKFGSNIIRAGGASNNALVLGATSGGVYLRPNGDTDTNGEFLVTSSNATYKGYTVWHSGNFVPSSKSDVGHIHADVISNGASGFITGADKAKLDTIAVSANNYVHPTGDGNNHVPANGTTNNNKVLKATAIAGSYAWGSVDWTELTSVPSTFAPSAHTHTASQITDLYSNIYTKTEVDTAVANAGDIKANQANVFKNLNTFNNAGMAIKIQPSAGVANATKLLQLNNVSGNELFSVNYSGGVSIAGDFVVTGQQIVSGTTNVNGDYTISGQLIVGGNSTLGDASTDVTTVNGTLKVQNGSIQEVGKYVQVHRRPVYGIAGDLQFQTDSNVFEDITDYYDLSAYALPAVQTGATRYYRLYVVYSDDITSTQASGGQVATVRISGATNKDLDLPWTWGAVNGRRDWYSAYFTDLPTGNGRIQAKLAQTGNNLGIRWVELVAYDKF